MRRRCIASLAALAAVWQLAEAPAYSHHSNVAFAVETVLTATGVVKEWQWTNPHTWLIMDVDDGKGGKVQWAMEGRAPGVLLRAGWSRSVLKAGDKVTVHYSPSKDGSKVGMIARVTLADGKVLPNAPPGD
ncbi:MAG TPA: DUF6152 family protein [Vicinamibacterales bacterium]|nr:DUF6152 family protein [Vicinamibacterales bacterium]